ncbi:MAG: DegT/DnrJ/EryC1/StrS family aminotransferase [Candidatus Dormibacteraeota bacterium]|nr:DegT/DnrJ/EryC1/StrS family aminotransferase [Candidatus Dormibacteraeota bacterium]
MTARRALTIAKVELGEEAIETAVRVLRSGRLRQGDVCAEFEARFAAAVGADHAVAVSSGTAALHLAWTALLEPGDEVLVPAFSFVASASSVALAGGRPVFCDVSPDTGTIDLGDASKRITECTRGIAPVHLYGGACDITGVRRFADEHGLRVVWDCAQAHGTTVGDRDVGSLPDLCCYSFYPSKAMTTGEGGMITSSDRELVGKLRLLRSHGQIERYLYATIGYNYRLTDFQAALGIHELKQLPRRLAARRRNAACLSQLLSDMAGVQLPVALPGTEHAYHQYTVRIDSERLGLSRDELQRRLGRDGVETAVHYPKALHQQPAFAAMAAGGSLARSEELARSVLSLPVHHGLAEDDLIYVAQSLRRAVENRGH